MWYGVYAVVFVNLRKGAAISLSEFSFKTQGLRTVRYSYLICLGAAKGVPSLLFKYILNLEASKCVAKDFSYSVTNLDTFLVKNRTTITTPQVNTFPWCTFENDFQSVLQPCGFFQVQFVQACCVISIISKSVGFTHQ